MMKETIHESDKPRIQDHFICLLVRQALQQQYDISPELLLGEIKLEVGGRVLGQEASISFSITFDIALRVGQARRTVR